VIVHPKIYIFSAAAKIRHLRAAGAADTSLSDNQGGTAGCGSYDQPWEIFRGEDGRASREAAAACCTPDHQLGRAEFAELEPADRASNRLDGEASGTACGWEADGFQCHSTGEAGDDGAVGPCSLPAPDGETASHHDRTATPDGLAWRGVARHHHQLRRSVRPL